MPSSLVRWGATSWGTIEEDEPLNQSTRSTPSFMGLEILLAILIALGMRKLRRALRN